MGDVEGWQPIETAPEYEDVLLCIPRYGVGIDMPVMAVGEQRNGIWYSCDSDEDDYVLHQPTHWMPLPAPPSALKPQHNTGEEG
jgi:hypothetical protein